MNGSFCRVIMLSCKGKKVFFLLAHKAPAQPVLYYSFTRIKGLSFQLPTFISVFVWVVLTHSSPSISVTSCLWLSAVVNWNKHVLFGNNSAFDIVIFVHAHYKPDGNVSDALMSCAYVCKLNARCLSEGQTWPTAFILPSCEMGWELFDRGLCVWARC